MPEIGELREAEEYAERVIDQARKDAQKTRLGIPARIEEMTREKDGRLMAVAAQAEAAVDAEMRELRGRLDSETSSRLRLLETRKGTLEQEALRMLGERVLHGRDSD
jgi:hypothetical protein